MARAKTLKMLFRRYRRPGDIVFAWFLLLFSILLLSQLSGQTTWRDGTALFAQPRFWPAISLGGMAVFAGFHLLGSALSERIDGRGAEIRLWLASFEYAGWFIAYALVVPLGGYLPTTTVFAVALALRSGYRSAGALILAAVAAAVIVVLFRSLLQVRIPAGTIYQTLPDGIRQFFLTYL